MIEAPRVNLSETESGQSDRILCKAEIEKQIVSGMKVSA